MSAPEIRYFSAPDGVRLAWREMGPETGDPRPVLLIHGYISDATTNWITYGAAGQLAAAGFRCIMPDLRAHGDSDKPHDPAAYPPDILADDQFALIGHLGLTDFDLAGYSLGARTAARMLAEWMAEAFVKTTGGDPIALDLILDTFVDTPRAVLAGLDLPVGVVCGVDDEDNGSAIALADLLPQGELISIPGNHMSAVTKSDFGRAFVEFLQKGRQS